MANVGAALTGTYIVNGSPTKTAIVDEGGGRSQLSQLTAAAIAVLVLIFATGAMGYLPEAVLSAVVFLIGVKLIDWRGMRTVWRQRPVEFWVAVLTTGTVVLVGIEEGIFVAVAVSIVAHIRHSYHPYDRLLARFEGKVWRSLPLDSGVQARKGLLIYRFGASLYYANASRFHEEVERLLRGREDPGALVLHRHGVGHRRRLHGHALARAHRPQPARTRHHGRALRRRRPGARGAEAGRRPRHRRAGARVLRHR